MLLNSPSRNGCEVSLFTGEIFTTLKMLENYPNGRKPMINGLFRYARGCFTLKFRKYQNFLKNTPKIIKNVSAFPYWSNYFKKVNIWSVLIYSVARTYKNDLIKNKLLKTSWLKKNWESGIDVSGMSWSYSTKE